MSFVKRMFGFGKKTNEGENEEDNNNSSTNNKTSESNTSKSKAVQTPYIEIKEVDLRIEQISLFDEKKKLIEEKLNSLFAEEAEKYALR